MRSNVRECAHVLLVNTLCLHLFSICATGVSSGLATRVTLHQVSWGKWEQSIYAGVDRLVIPFL
jgi:hypothetical protein